MAKDPTSRYVSGRTLKWLKVKQPKYRECERGWEPKRKIVGRQSFYWTLALAGC